MRKLALATVAFSLAAFGAFYLFPLSALFPLSLVLAAAALILFFFRKKSRLLRRLFLCFLGAALGLAMYQAHWAGTLRYAEIWDGTEQTVSVRVMEAPAELDYSVRLHVQRTEKPHLDMMLYDYNGTCAELKPGDIVLLTARLRRADLRYGERNDAYVSKDIYLTGSVLNLDALTGRRHTVRTLAAAVGRRISDFAAEVFSPDTQIFMRSLMLGDKTDFYRDTALYARMRGAGFMHVVAVSGMHIAFLVGMIQLLFGQRPVSSVAGILLVWFFVFMTGASPSAVRAGIMQTILLTAPLVRRENDGPTSLAAALAFILLINPFGCGSVSLQLSFAAMAGMVLLAEPITALLLRAFGCDPQSRLRPAFSVIGGSLAVLICSTPFSVLHFGTLAIWSPLTNLLGLWAVSLCFCGGYLTLAGTALFAPLGKLLLIPTELLARYLILLAGFICRLPHNLIPMRGADMLLWLLLCYILFFLAWRSRAHDRLRVLLPAALCILTLTAALTAAKARYRSGEAIIAVLDVGQGECVCALSEDNTLMFDCGGLGSLDNAGEVAADWLESAGRDHVDTLVLSHLHADHCNGVTMLLELIPVEEIVFSPNADADEEMLPEILNAAQKHNTRVTELRADTEMSYGKLRLRMFAPPESGNENERCIISLLSVGDYDMLFTGDAPKKAERDLLEHTELPDAELLIVGHHGS
ncbi:MAG: ComEC/Rec2 family competence protein, partial [Oscillospiraceae bacterium]|nr:ComEC/Rec2 family competence protein [Oscillospiraceae bacterium]